MVALDPLEQLHPDSLDTEHADASADLRPFLDQVAFDELVRQLAHVQPCFIRVMPDHLSRAGQGSRRMQVHRPAGEEPQVLSRLRAALGLAEAASTYRNDRIAAQHRAPAAI